jgi:hypothetical protein
MLNLKATRPQAELYLRGPASGIGLEPGCVARQVALPAQPDGSRQQHRTLPAALVGQ